ncbi:MAG: hypothetical protein WBX01_11160 [Nitrososphaeraceae archaeon]
MDQLLQNMEQTGTQVGILATKTFPTEALSEKMYVPHITNNPTNGTIMVVKLEFVALAYFALRQLVIQMNRQAEELENLKEAKTDDDAEETVRALIEF